MGCIGSKEEGRSAAPPVTKAPQPPAAPGKVAAMPSRPQQEQEKAGAEPADSSSSVEFAFVTSRKGEDDQLQFRRFTLNELVAATNSFSERCIVSEGGTEAENVVYRGRLSNGQIVAIKSLHRREWPDEEAFIAEATKVGKVRHSGLVALLGFCSHEQSRLLVAEFMPNSTLTQHLFHYEKQPMTLQQRLRAALVVTRALFHLKKEGLPSYSDLSTYRVLFDADLAPRLSCFGLINNGGHSSSLAIPPDFLSSGSRTVTAESMVYSLGTLLLALLSGKRIKPNQFLELVDGKASIDVVVDSSITERQAAMELVLVVADSLNSEPESRPSLSEVIERLQSIEAKIIDKDSVTENFPEVDPPMEHPPLPEGAQLWLSPFAQAASEGNLTTIHTLLVKDSYGTPPQDPSFESWKPEMQQMLDARKKGDHAFKAKRWHDAIQYYAQYRQLDTAKLPLMFARRCLCYLQLGEWNLALTDAMTVQFEDAAWPEGCYLQAVALRHVRLEQDAQEMLAKGVRLEQERRESMQRSRSQSPRRRF